MTLTGNGTIDDTVPGVALSEPSVDDFPQRRDRRATTRLVLARTLPRGSVWTACLIVAALLIVLGEPLSVAALSVALAGMSAAAIASARGEGSTSLMAALPAGFVLLVGWSLMWGLAGGALGVGAWSGRGASLGGVALYAALTGISVWRRRGAVVGVGRDGAGTFGFLCLVGFFGWVIATQPLELWSRVNSTGTGFLRHVRMIEEVRNAGLIVPGELSNPRALHALGGWLTGALDAPVDADSGWRLLAPIGFLMLGLMLLSVMIIATRLADHIGGRSWVGSSSGIVAGVVFVQTAWFDTFLALGNVMNMVVGVALLSVLVFGLDPTNLRWVGGGLVSAAAVAVVANAWQLLAPVMALAALPWFVQSMRHGRRRKGEWVVWGLSAALVVHGLGLVPGGGSRLSSPSTTTGGAFVSHLFRPDWWWLVAIGIAVLASALAFRGGWRTWALSYAGMLGGAVGLVALLMHLSGSSWELMPYYPAEVLWTTMVVVIPAAVAGGLFGLRCAWGLAGQKRPAMRMAARGVVIVVVFTVAAGAAGRGFAFPPHLSLIAQGRSGPPNWSLAVVNSLGNDADLGGAANGALVFGIVPAADVHLASGDYLGVVDAMAMEGISLRGAPWASPDPIKGALMARDMEEICRYLEDRPDSVRVTGPNLMAGPSWIVDSGCPVDVVRPSNWIVLDIDPKWTQRSPWEDGSRVFPGFAEVQGLRGTAA